MAKNTLIVLVGPPCSGKSTWIKNNIPTDGTWVVVSSDQYIEDRAKEEGRSYRFVHEKHIDDATRHCFEVYREAVANGKNIVVDRTNMTASSRRRWTSSVGKNTTKIALIFSVSDDELFYRNQQRERATGKAISFEIFGAMLSDYVEPCSEEGFDLIRKIT